MRSQPGGEQPRVSRSEWSRGESPHTFCSKDILSGYKTLQSTASRQFIDGILNYQTFRIFGGTLVIVRGGKKFMYDESKQKLYQVMQVFKF